MKKHSATKNRRQLVFLFEEDAQNSPMVRGGKGSGLADLTKLGIPVPPGFTVATTAARAMSEKKGRLPQRLEWQIKRGTSITKNLGGPIGIPPLFSVRSGAPISMPGMMDTILNLGLTPRTAKELALKTGEKFAYDCYRRFLAAFGQVVGGIPKQRFEVVLNNIKAKFRVETDQDLKASALKKLCAKYRSIVLAKVDREIMDDPEMQLRRAIKAVVSSWDNSRAQEYRKAHKIPHWWGTAVNVQQMVYGNRDDNSCTGVVFSRNVATGEDELYGEFLVEAQGEDVVSGTRKARPISELNGWNSQVYEELKTYAKRLEKHFRDVVDIEFTVESGKLYILQCRIAKRTPQAAAFIAVHKVWQKTWTKEEALKKLTLEQIGQLSERIFSREFIDAHPDIPVASGLPASPGVVVGAVVITHANAKFYKRLGRQVVLIRPDTNPDDFSTMLVSDAIVTASGGFTSHAAVVARSLGIPAVVGADIRIETGSIGQHRVIINGQKILSGETVSVDGTTGKVYLGNLPFSRSRRKEADIFKRWAGEKRIQNKLIFSPPKLFMKWADERLSGNMLAGDFYLLDRMRIEAKKAFKVSFLRELEVLYQKQVSRNAEAFLCYIALAVAGELRHVQDRSTCNPADINSHNVSILTAEFGLTGPKSSRRECQESVSSCLMRGTHDDHVRFFTIATAIFQSRGWSTSFGGQKWAVISQTALDFLTGDINHVAFVDRCFDLEHNLGKMFNKHPMLEETVDGLLEAQLDSKRSASDIRSLFGGLAAYGHSSFSPEVLAAWKKGVKAGIW